jgi:MYXO-CTERM domain-containing protein
MMPWIRGGSVGVAAAVAVVGRVETAAACRFPCESPVRLQGMEYVPGNLVYFQVTADNPGSMALRTDVGEPIPASLRTMGGGRVFAPDAPIEPGTNVVLEYALVCYPGSDIDREGDVPTLGEFAFETSDHAPLTVQEGSMYVEEYGIELPAGTSQELAFVRVRPWVPSVDASAEHLVTYTLRVDGEPWSAFAFEGSHWQVSIESQCGVENDEYPRDSCGGISFVSVGHHTLELTPHVAGYEGEIAPMTLEIETRCPSDDGSLASRSCSLQRGRSPAGRVPSSGMGAALLALGAVAWVRRRRHVS